MSIADDSGQGAFWETGEPVKRCAGCKRMLPLTEFYTILKRRRQSMCKDCTKEDTKRRHKEGYYRAYYARQETKDRQRAKALRRAHGIEPEDYEALEKEQRGACAICGRTDPLKTRHGTDKKLSVDHDHDTGKVRGLLCQHCNLALGKFKDDPQILRNALAYLAKYGKG